MKAVIIGGVAAGMSAAGKIKRLNPENQVVVYEMGSLVSYGACGLPYYVSGLNKDPEKMIIRRADDFRKQGIEVHLRHQVLRVSPEDKSVLVRNLESGALFMDTYDKLLIASGARAVRPPIPGIDSAGVHTLKTYHDGLALHDSLEGAEQVAVIGGGYIGVEVAESLSAAGKKVRLIEMGPHLLAPFDLEIVRLLYDRMVESGIEIRLQEGLEKIVSSGGRVAGIRTAKREYPADVVVLALGVRPATDFLEGTGIRLSGNGAVETDRYMRTSLPHIYAAGDCASIYSRIEEANTYLALGTVANKCGRIAGENMAGGRVRFNGCLGSSAISVCGLEAARTGLSEAAAKELFPEVVSVVIQSHDRPPYYPSATPLTVKLICEKRSRRILGGQAVGEKGAVLRVDAIAAAITGNLTAPDLGMADFCYAPPFAEVWDALNIAGNAIK